MKYTTTQRRQLYEFLKDNPHKYFTAKQIEAALIDAGVEISISAIYRNLSALLKTGAIKKAAERDSKESCYRFVDSECCKDEIHITCTMCGKIFHMEHVLTAYMQQQLLFLNDFQLDPSKTVISGICSECRRRSEFGSWATEANS